MNHPPKKRFSGFSLAEAIWLLDTNELKEWTLKVSPRPPSILYQQWAAKLKSNFDLSLSEAAKSMLIDAILLEVVDDFEGLKVWKEANLQTDTITGTADYLVAPQGLVYRAPLLCVVEAKKDDFEKGLAQCLVEMWACRWYNQSVKPFDIFGIITNSLVWRFYKLTPTNEVYESSPYSESLEQILGILHWILGQCESHLKSL